MRRTGGGIVYQSLTAIDKSLALLGTALLHLAKQKTPSRGACCFGGEGGIVPVSLKAIPASLRDRACFSRTSNRSPLDFG
jgi:hypothetical protein